MSNTEYKPAEYWSEVGERVDSREDSNIIAGDDEPYYHYKREELLKLLDEVDLRGKSVLEVGPGPGGNLKGFSALNIAKSLVKSQELIFLQKWCLLQPKIMKIK